MAEYQIFYVGTQAEVSHHAAPLESLSNLRIADPADVARFAKPNDLAIFFSEHFHRFRKAWLELSDKGCNTLYAIDGILEWRNAWENREDEPACPWTMRPVLSDKVACIGASQARVLDTWGNQEKTEVVGIPRFEDLRKRYLEIDNVRSTANERPFRVLVTTAKWPGFTPAQREQVTQSLLDLKNYFEENAAVTGRPVEVVWRLTGDLDRAICVENHLTDTTGQELATVLDSVDAVITTPSTVMLEAMLCRIPLCLIDYTNSPRYVDAVWSISARDQIADVMEQLARSPVRKMMFQQSVLEDALQCRENATDRLLQLAREMIRLGHDCRAANQPVVFPRNILPPLESGTDLELDRVFPDRPRLTGTREHHAVAIESLRRVDHLQDRVDLLEAELARAADGFDRIASHPVLAPLVKLRKLALNMGGRIAGILHNGKDEKEPSDRTTQGGIKLKT